MKITRRKLAQMIEREVRAHLLEDDGKKSAKKKSKKPGAGGGKPGVAAADDDDSADLSTPAGGGPDPIASAPPIDGGMRDDGEADLEAEPEDPTDGEGEDDAEAIDAAGDAGEDPSGAVNDEVSGKTIQSITIEPKSKVLPGAKEVVVSFNESTDALRVLVTATGQVKFFWRGQLHDIP